jgi:hypothetical protein
MVEEIGGTIGLADTEASRANFYADDFTFQHLDLTPPFTPERYLQVIELANKAKHSVFIIDSMSHEWAGEGGILEQHEAELTRRAGNDWTKRQKLTMSCWVAPKMAHKSLVYSLLQSRAHLIFCFRAEDKVDMKASGTKDIITRWQAVTDKAMLFEMHDAILLADDTPGIPSAPYRPFKIINDHRSMFPAGKQISRETGRLLARWAKGTSPQEKLSTKPVQKFQEKFGEVEKSMKRGKRFGVQIDGLAYGTHDETLAGAALALRGKRVRVTFEQKGKKRELQSVDAAPSEPPGSPEEPREPETPDPPADELAAASGLSGEVQHRLQRIQAAVGIEPDANGPPPRRSSSSTSSKKGGLFSGESKS